MYKTKNSLLIPEKKITLLPDETSASQHSSCFYCDLKNDGNKEYENELAFVLAEEYMVGKKQTLIIPKRHVSDFLKATNEEKQALFELLKTKKEEFQNEDPLIKSFTIEIKTGGADKRSLSHFHLYLSKNY